MPDQMKPRPDLKAIRKERGRIYGDPLENHQGIALMWAPLLYEQRERVGRMEPIEPWVVTAMFALLKINRMRLGIYHPDNFDDAVNYLRFTQEFQAQATKGKP